MIYRYALLFFLFLLNSLALEAQSSLPTATQTPVWQVLDHLLQENQLNHDVWYTDTAIDSCSTAWTPIFVQREYYPTPFFKGYYRNSDQQVYFRKTLDCNQSEYLLYDFSLSVGDSVGIYDESALSDNRINYHVTETGTRCYGGVERRYLSVGYEIGDPDDVFSYYDYYQTVWVEGIGDITHPFKGLDCVSSVDDVCENYVYVECLNTNGGLLYSRDETSGCSYENDDPRNCLSIADQVSETLTPIGDVITQKVISIFPNPIHQGHPLHIGDTGTPIPVNIYLPNGQLVWSGKSTVLMSNPISLQKGAYLVNIRNSKGLQQWQRLIVY